MAGNDELSKEVASLREQLSELRAQDRKRVPDQEEASHEQVEDTGSGADSKESEPEFAERLEELLDLLDNEAKKRPTFSALVVFSLGVILGRYLK